MGGCASKPKDLKTAEVVVPAPVEALVTADAPTVPETPVAAAADEAETAAVPEEKKEDGVEPKKDEPLVDLSEPAPVKAEEAVQTESKPAEVEVVQAESKPVEEEKKEVA